MNEIEKKLPSIIEDKDLSALADSIADMVNEAKSHLVQTVNTTLVQTNWNIGRYKHGKTKIAILQKRNVN